MSPRFSRWMLWLLVCALSLVLIAARAAQPLPGFVQAFVGQGPLVQGRGFYTSFETVGDFANFYIVPQNHRRSASHDLSDEAQVSGRKAHKAWIYASNPLSRDENTNHRAYPTIQFAKSPLGIIKGAVLVEFWVWADIDLSRSEGRNWFSLATFTSYDDAQWFRAYLINVDASYRIHLMHVPHQGASAADIDNKARITLPRRQWAKITAYIDHGRANRFQSPFVAVWQDASLVAASRFNDRISLDQVPRHAQPPCLRGWDGQSVEQAESLCQLKYTGGLAQAHFGLYAPPLLSSGTIFNDDLSVTEVLPATR